MKILLTTEDAKYAEAAVRALIRQIRPEGAEVCVFHVVAPLVVIPYGYMGQAETLEAAQEARRKEGKELAEHAAQQLRAAGFQVDPLLGDGDPKTTILDKAQEWNADVIFMGSHGRRGIERFLIGSVSEAVLRHASCSVELVRAPVIEGA